MRQLLVVAVILVLASVSGHSTEKSPISGIPDTVWEQVVKGQYEKNSNNCDASELFHKLNMVASGRTLSPEAYDKTLKCALKPSKDFGIIQTGGYKWMTAVFILSQQEQANKIRSLENSNRELQQDIQALRNEIQALKESAITRSAHK